MDSQKKGNIGNPLDKKKKNTLERENNMKKSGQEIKKPLKTVPSIENIKALIQILEFIIPKKKYDII